MSHYIHHAPSSNERWHALDAVRGIALLLGVFLHASLSYVPGSEYWYIVSESASSTTLAALFFVVHSFRMLTFFLIAGFFGRLALQRLGGAGFIRDRAKRIGLPLVAGWMPIFAAIVAVVVWAAWIKGGGSLPQDPPPGPAFTPDDFPLTHLWFLYVLMLFYTAALMLRGLLMLDRRGSIAALCDRFLSVLLRGWAAVLLAIPLAAALTISSKWSPWFGIPTPDQSLYPNIAALVGYGMAFALGWGIQRQPKILLGAIIRIRHQSLALAVVGLSVCVAMLGLAPNYSPEQGTAELRLVALAYAVFGWGLSLALIGYALQHLSGYSVWRRYLADASYWIYLVHLPIVMALQVVASQFNLPWWIEYPLQLGLAMSIMLLTYHWWVRGTWIGAMLNGRRHGVARQQSTVLPPDAVAGAGG